MWEIDLNIPTIVGGASGLLIYITGTDKPEIRHYGYDIVTGTFNFIGNLDTSENPANDYGYYRHVSAGFIAQSSTTSGTAFVIQGTMSAIAFEAIPPIQSLTPSTISQYKRANYDAVTSVPAADGVVVVAPLVEEYKFRPFRANRGIFTDAAGTQTVQYDFEQVALAVWRAGDGLWLTNTFAAGVLTTFYVLSMPNPRPWGQVKVSGTIQIRNPSATTNVTAIIRVNRRSGNPNTYAQVISADDTQTIVVAVTATESLIIPFIFYTAQNNDFELENVTLLLQFGAATTTAGGSTFDLTVESSSYLQKQLNVTGLMVGYQNLTQQQVSVRGCCGLEVIPKFNLTRNVPVGYNNERDAISETCRNAYINSLGHPIKHVYQRSYFMALSSSGALELDAKGIVAKASTKSFFRKLGEAMGVRDAINVGGNMLSSYTGSDQLGRYASSGMLRLWDGLTSEGSNVVANTTTRTPQPRTIARCSTKPIVSDAPLFHQLNDCAITHMSDGTFSLIKMTYEDSARQTALHQKRQKRLTEQDELRRQAVLNAFVRIDQKLYVIGLDQEDYDEDLVKREGWVTRTFDDELLLFKVADVQPEIPFKHKQVTSHTFTVVERTTFNIKRAERMGINKFTIPYPGALRLMVLIQKLARASTTRSAEEEIAAAMGVDINGPPPPLDTKVPKYGVMKPVSLGIFRGANGRHAKAVASLQVGLADEFDQWYEEFGFTFQQFPAVVGTSPKMSCLFLSNRPMSYKVDQQFRQMVSHVAVPYHKEGDIHVSNNIPDVKGLEQLLDRSAIFAEVESRGDVYLTCLVEEAYFDIGGSSYSLALQGLMLGCGSSIVLTGSPEPLDETDLLRKLVVTRASGMKLVIYDPSLSLETFRSKLKNPESCIAIDEAMLFGIYGRDAILCNKLVSFVGLLRLCSLAHAVGGVKGANAQVGGSIKELNAVDWGTKTIRFHWPGDKKNSPVTEDMTFDDFINAYHDQVESWKTRGNNSVTWVALQELRNKGDPKLEKALTDLGGYSLRMKHMKKGVPGVPKQQQKIQNKRGTVANTRVLLMKKELARAKQEEPEEDYEGT